MLLINCDPFRSVYLLLAISLRQLFSRSILELHKIRKKGLHQSFFPVEFVNIFGTASVSGFALLQLYQNNTA